MKVNLEKKKKLKFSGGMVFIVGFGLGVFLPFPLRADEALEEQERGFYLNPAVAFKSSVLVPEGGVASHWWRARFSLKAKRAKGGFLELAYEQRVIYQPQNSENLTITTTEIKAPFRLIPLEGNLVERYGEYFYRHELDRAFIAFQQGFFYFTVGRQAVGLGRGAIFSAVDIFSPFSPFELDREWRRGVDSARLEMRFLNRYSADVISALGEEWGSSAFLGRVRGYAGIIEGEFILGKRYEDYLLASVISGILGDTEIHGEGGVFKIPEKIAGAGFNGADDWIVQALLGASRNFNIGNGFTIFVEYYYSGFGSEQVAEFRSRVLDTASDFQERMKRGDIIMMGKQHLGVRGIYTIAEFWTVNLFWMGNLTDGSGVFSLALNWSFSDHATLIASYYYPYGKGRDEDGNFRSEYGAFPPSGFLQMNLYY